MGKKDIELNIDKRKSQIIKITNRVISVFLSLVISILLITSMVLTYELVTLNEERENLAGFSVLSILEDSVESPSKSGDLLVVKSVPLKDLEVGDVIAFRNESKIITHKIKNISENDYITIGADGSSDDSEVIIDYGSVIGKQVFNIPKGDILLEISHNPTFTFIVFLLLLVNISFLFKSFS